MPLSKIFNCKRVSTLTSEQLDRPLSWYERIGVAVHRVICGPCRIYQKQMGILNSRVATVQESDAPQASLDGDARERIRARLADRHSRTNNSDS